MLTINSDSFFTLTFKNDKRVMEKAIELHHEYLEVMLNSDIKGNWTLQDMFQPVPAFFAEHGQEKGGNVLGLERFDDNLQRKFRSHQPFQLYANY